MIYFLCDLQIYSHLTSSYAARQGDEYTCISYLTSEQEVHNPPW